jgi:GNAT superfamily N-acetyltransferase
VVVRSARDGDDEQLTALIAAFRVELAAFKQQRTDPDQYAALMELADYRANRFRLAVAESDEGHVIGFIACRIEDDVVWAESLYVVPEYRRVGVCLASRKCIVRRPKCAQANRRAWGWVFVPFRASSSG